ncbi:hypothetical protein FB565_006910 [Actinoplanes lutulentus]|uniref:Sortase family protein n=1 Tax=Actinoplanes lutulentus TaxID=1287878 RepID=A0A327ZIA7_9ACTN|nr:class F sortase [Actinoplanes lutulentus]MBB2947142.1 hypothetical protein [Actinoplanes lutulentus]RAK36418.1 sortase family protein [Actinoplanes lutulentus]
MSISGHGGASRFRPGRALLIVAAGVILVAVVAVVMLRSRPAADFGAPPISASVASASVASASVASASVGSASQGPSGSVGVPINDGLDLAVAAAEAPSRLRIPALGVDAAVEAVGIDARSGDFAVPADVGRVGWYRFGPGFEAVAGSIVVAGHVDAADQGKGVFFRLGSLKAGDVVTLTGLGGVTRDFEVVARERYRKVAVPLEQYFARDGSVRLTLITCGGTFDAKTRHYRDNVVITAR